MVPLNHQAGMQDIFKVHIRAKYVSRLFDSVSFGARSTSHIVSCQPGSWIPALFPIFS